MKNERVLLVEDEDDIREVMKVQFERLGYHVTEVENGDDAIELVQNDSFDLFVIDRMLPGTPGLEICKFIRNFKKTRYNPILIVTALTQNREIIEGLDAGADDYITKPFDIEVLTARAKSLLRRYKNSLEHKSREGHALQFGKLTIDLDAHEVSLEGKRISLTKSEFDILTVLVQNAGKVLTRHELVRHIQGENIHVTARTIDTHIVGIRKKLQTSSALIETIRGVGYRIMHSEA